MTSPRPSCPVCESPRLEPGRLAEGLKADVCPACHGSWINGIEYFDWLSAQVSHAAEDTGEQDAALATAGSDSDAGKLCLDCGRYMRRVAVGHGQGFFLDRCTSCGGFWFDAHEWAALRRSGLHREAHQVFTDSWQAEVRRQSSAQADQRRLADRLGEDGLARLEEIKGWLAEHPRSREILAALTAGKHA